MDYNRSNQSQNNTNQQAASEGFSFKKLCERFWNSFRKSENYTPKSEHSDNWHNGDMQRGTARSRKKKGRAPQPPKEVAVTSLSNEFPTSYKSTTQDPNQYLIPVDESQRSQRQQYEENHGDYATVNNISKSTRRDGKSRTFKDATYSTYTEPGIQDDDRTVPTLRNRKNKSNKSKDTQISPAESTSLESANMIYVSGRKPSANEPLSPYTITGATQHATTYSTRSKQSQDVRTQPRQNQGHYSNTLGKRRTSHEFPVAKKRSIDNFASDQQNNLVIETSQLSLGYDHAQELLKRSEATQTNYHPAQNTKDLSAEIYEHGSNIRNFQKEEHRQRRSYDDQTKGAGADTSPHSLHSVIVHRPEEIGDRHFESNQQQQINMHLNTSGSDYQNLETFMKQLNTQNVYSLNCMPQSIALVENIEETYRTTNNKSNETALSDGKRAEQELFLQDSLQKISSVHQEVQALEEEIDTFLGTSIDDRDYVYLDEVMMRSLIKLDNLETRSNDEIKQERKKGIKVIQRMLKNLDAKLKENISKQEGATGSIQSHKNRQEGGNEHTSSNRSNKEGAAGSIQSHKNQKDGETEDTSYKIKSDKEASNNEVRENEHTSNNRSKQEGPANSSIHLHSNKDDAENTHTSSNMKSNKEATNYNKVREIGHTSKNVKSEPQRKLKI